MHDTSQAPEPPRATTREELERSRVLRAVVAPSGNRYDIRPLNLERHALSGSLPANLRSAAMKGAEGVNELLGAADDKLSEQGREVQEYLDQLVAETIVSPNLFVHHPESGTVKVDDTTKRKVVDSELVEMLQPVDYRWALAIAMNECDTDGAGARLWGREPLSRWESFRLEHRCEEDCEGCQRLVDRFSAAL